jgi:hypothetical protein
MPVLTYGTRTSARSRTGAHPRAGPLIIEPDCFRIHSPWPQNAGGLLLGPGHGGWRHTAIPHHHPFRAQAAGLFAVLVGVLRKHDAAAGPDDTVPGQMQRFWCHPQRESCLARTTRQSGGAGNSSVGGDLSPRNGADHVPDRLECGIICRGKRLARPGARCAQGPKQGGGGRLRSWHGVNARAQPGSRALYENF